MSEYATHYEVNAMGWALGLVKCLECGATVMLEEREGIGVTSPAMEIHDRWHDRIDVIMTAEGDNERAHG